MIDEKGIKALQINLKEYAKELDGVQLEVGIFDEEVGEYAAYNELGTKTIPARPFVGTFLNERGDKVTNAFPVFVESSGLTINSVEKLGELMTAEMRLHIRDYPWKLNKESTIKRKKGDKAAKPLIDTGRLINSIEYRIVK